MTSNVASSSAQLQKQIQAKVNARTQSNPFVVDAPDDIETFRRQLLAEKEQVSGHVNLVTSTKVINTTSEYTMDFYFFVNTFSDQ